MAQKVHIELIDDIDGSAAEDTVVFGLDGNSYEIDLSTANASSLRKGLEEYVKAGRKLTKSGKATGRANGQVTETMAPSQREIRDWARSNGVEVPERGSIPRSVREQFEAATA